MPEPEFYVFKPSRAERRKFFEKWYSGKGFIHSYKRKRKPSKNEFDGFL